MLMVATPCAAIDICSGGSRAARMVTCLVDGDTGWERGVKWRLLDIDAPETFEAACPREKMMGKEATARLRELMAGGHQIVVSGRKDRTSDRRAIVRVILPDGRNAAQVLLREGLAQRWPNKGSRWWFRPP